MHDTNTLDEVRTVFAEADAMYRKIGSTVLYAHLTAPAVDDDAILELMLPCNDTKKLHIMLLSIVHYLLLKDAAEGRRDALADYYASLTPEPLPPQGAYPHFRAYCLAHADEIKQLAADRYLHYVALGRAANQLVAFGLIAQRLDGAPFALFDVGSSAGLLLQWDHYRYVFGEHMVGPAASPLTVVCDVRGPWQPPLPEHLPAVGARMGIDVEPIDLDDTAQRLWLLGNVPAYNRQHAHQVEQAIALCRAHKPAVLLGDANHDVLAQGRDFAPGEPLVVVDSFLPLHLLPVVEDQVRQLAQERRVFHVTLGYLDGECRLRLIDYGAGTKTYLARTNVPGSYIEWLDETTAVRRRDVAS